MDGDSEIANNIINKEFSKRRYKKVNSIEKLKIECIMLEISDCHSPSVVL